MILCIFHKLCSLFQLDNLAWNWKLYPLLYFLRKIITCISPFTIAIKTSSKSHKSQLNCIIHQTKHTYPILCSITHAKGCMPKEFQIRRHKKILKTWKDLKKTSHKNWGIFIFLSKKRQSQVNTSTSHREFKRGKGKTENKGLRNKNIKAIWIVRISHLLKD